MLHDILDISNDPDKIITLVITCKGDTDEIRDLHIAVIDDKDVYNAVRVSEFQINELHKALEGFKNKSYLTDTEKTNEWAAGKV